MLQNQPSVEVSRKDRLRLSEERTFQNVDNESILEPLPRNKRNIPGFLKYEDGIPRSFQKYESSTWTVLTEKIPSRTIIWKTCAIIASPYALCML